MFQRSALLPWRNVLDNVLLPVDVSNGDRTAARRDAQELIELTGLHRFERARRYELSGGMQQRAALCRALISTAARDADGRAVRRARRAHARRVCWSCSGCGRSDRSDRLVTHSIDEAVLLSDRHRRHDPAARAHRANHARRAGATPVASAWRGTPRWPRPCASRSFTARRRDTPGAPLAGAGRDVRRAGRPLSDIPCRVFGWEPWLVPPPADVDRGALGLPRSAAGARLGDAL